MARGSRVRIREKADRTTTGVEGRRGGNNAKSTLFGLQQVLEYKREEEWLLRSSQALVLFAPARN
jgi:hypothetical protein